MLYQIRTKQFLKIDLKTAWDFISSPKNLATITPSYMGFVIKSPPEDIEKMYAGQIIEYDVTPLLGIKMRWVTEITYVEPGHYFVDIQRFGPYALWHHKHFLKEVPGGVEVTDLIHYKPPFGLLGRLAHALFIKKQLKTVFDYRHQKLETLFNQK